ncbi:MAG: FAD-binding protein [Planctomycetes bacterium]|nr:FAD-binding protein [Planctomycetota bacterium]
MAEVIAENVAEDLRGVIRGDVFGDILHRGAFSSDASIYQVVPLCVVAVRDSYDVSVVVKYAASEGISIVARGAGSGLAGESLCGGIVLDMRRYMNRIIEFDEGSGVVLCEPGVVLDELNNYLGRYGRKIGPDPSSGNRATIGGCVANNSTGAHCLQYGFMGDYVESVEVVLANGSVVDLVNDFDPDSEISSGAVNIARKCQQILGGKDEIINNALPKTSRNRSGYNIAGICHEGKVDLARLVASSEGTLAIFTKIALSTVAVEAARGILNLEFDSLEEMGRAVPKIVDSGAAACELMDRSLLEMARGALPEYSDILPEGVEASILVEHVGGSSAEVSEKIKRTDKAVGKIASGRSVILDGDVQRRLWKSRKDAVPLLYRKKGRKKPVAFMEDVSVGKEHLAEYIRGVKEIGKRYEVEMSFYGHAGDGVLHVRPYLDLSDKKEVEKMRSMAEDVFSLAWSLGGSISGEHGDGFVRTAFIRGQYGDEYYELLGAVKNIFDPEGLMNPGKIVGGDADVMVTNLKASHKFLPERLRTRLLMTESDFAAELGQCNGCGVCLSRSDDQRMCPVFRALGEELDSSRAKVNILSLWVSGQLTDEEFESSEFEKFLDLCVNCKACSLQCPSGVDISKLMLAARAEYVKRKGLGKSKWVLSRNRYFSKFGSEVSDIVNLVSKSVGFKWLGEKIIGIGRKRALPKFAHGEFLKAGREYLAKCEPIKEPVGKVAYFLDTYVNFHDHELGFAVLDVLRCNGIAVVLPNQRPAPLPSIMYGDVKRARKDLEYNIKYLAQAVRDGCEIICSEPSAALCLQKDLKYFVAGEDAELVCGNTHELMGYLLGLCNEGKLKPIEGLAGENFVYHCPCHLFAAGGGRASIELLDKLCGIKVFDLKAGCCGMAGTFGMLEKNYELSEKMAERLKGALKEVPAKCVLTECGACKMQIEHISDKQVMHPVKVLARAYGA